MEIVPDPLLVVMFLPPFLVAVGVMWLVLWRPLLVWMNEREDAVADAKAEAARLDAAVVDNVKSLEERLGAVRSELAELRGAARAEATEAERVVMAAAQTTADAKVEAATKQIAEETEVARRGLADASRALADDMASQVLGRPLEA